MATLKLTIDAQHLHSEASRHAIEQAAAILRGGGTVAFPTETVYGLGANALDAAAVEKIFAAKQRPTWDPLIVHVSDSVMLSRVVSALSESATCLIDRFWPGPLTLLLPRNEAVPAAVTAGRERVGVRMPAHRVAHALICAAGIPIAAPSANSFGRISPTTAAHVAEDLEGRIDAILDGGPTSHGLESTVIDAWETPCLIYRPGVISLEQIQSAGVPVALFHETSETRTAKVESLPSPGVGIRHYAPRARLILVDSPPAELSAALEKAVRNVLQDGKKVGLMLPEDFAVPNGGDVVVFHWGRTHEEMAQRLYAGLRHLDKAGVVAIICPLPSAEGIGRAMQDRLLKAARPE